MLKWSRNGLSSACATSHKEKGRKKKKGKRQINVSLWRKKSQHLTLISPRGSSCNDAGEGKQYAGDCARANYALSFSLPLSPYSVIFFVEKKAIFPVSPPGWRRLPSCTPRRRMDSRMT